MRTAVILKCNYYDNDAIIESQLEVKRENGGKIVWVDEKAGIAKHKRVCKHVTIYYSSGKLEAIPLQISKETISYLYAEMKKHEADDIEEIYHDELPF